MPEKAGNFGEYFFKISVTSLTNPALIIFLVRRAISFFISAGVFFVPIIKISKRGSPFFLCFENGFLVAAITSKARIILLLFCGSIKFLASGSVLRS